MEIRTYPNYTLSRIRTTTTLSCAGCGATINPYEPCWETGLNHYHEGCKPTAKVEVHEVDPRKTDDQEILKGKK